MAELTLPCNVAQEDNLSVSIMNDSRSINVSIKQPSINSAIILNAENALYLMTWLVDNLHDKSFSVIGQPDHRENKIAELTTRLEKVERQIQERFPDNYQSVVLDVTKEDTPW